VTLLARRHVAHDVKGEGGPEYLQHLYTVHYAHGALGGGCEGMGGRGGEGGGHRMAVVVVQVLEKSVFEFIKRLAAVDSQQSLPLAYDHCRKEHEREHDAACDGAVHLCLQHSHPSACRRQPHQTCGRPLHQHD